MNETTSAVHFNFKLLDKGIIHTFLLASLSEFREAFEVAGQTTGIASFMGTTLSVILFSFLLMKTTIPTCKPVNTTYIAY